VLAGTGISNPHRHLDRLETEPLAETSLHACRRGFGYPIRVQGLAMIEVDLACYKKPVGRANTDAARPYDPCAPRGRPGYAVGFLQRQLGHRGHDFFMDAKLATLAPPPHRRSPTFEPPGPLWSLGSVGRDVNGA
jgi:hypothetical protein